jgi:hypothetical protein
VACLDQPDICSTFYLGILSMFKLPIVLMSTIILANTAAGSITYTATPDTYLSLLRKLVPGNQQSLPFGIYETWLPIHDPNGAAQASIVFTSPDDALPAILLAQTRRNTVSRPVLIRNLTLDGAVLPVVGVKCYGYAMRLLIHWKSRTCNLLRAS